MSSHLSGQLQLSSSGQLQVSSAASNGPLDVTDASWRVKKTARVPLAAVDTAGGIFAWANPESSAILVTRVVLDVTTVATAACSISVGQAANGTTSAANLIDTLDVHSAIGPFDNITDKGTNGKSRQKVAAGAFVTGSKASGASAGLVGFAYIEYFAV